MNQRPKRSSRNRWMVYCLVGVAFGVIDYYYQQYAVQFSDSSILQIIVVLGIWLIPLLPVVVYETNISKSKKSGTLSGVVVWSIAVLAYYAYMMPDLLVIGKESRPEMHISSASDPYFWSNFTEFIRGSIIGGMIEWIAVAIIGGAIMGYLISAIFTRVAALSAKTAQDT